MVRVQNPQGDHMTHLQGIANNHHPRGIEGGSQLHHLPGHYHNNRVPLQRHQQQSTPTPVPYKDVVHALKQHIIQPSGGVNPAYVDIDQLAYLNAIQEKRYCNVVNTADYIDDDRLNALIFHMGIHLLKELPILDIEDNELLRMSIR